jgi:hypothetical protein
MPPLTSNGTRFPIIIGDASVKKYFSERHFDFHTDLYPVRVPVGQIEKHSSAILEVDKHDRAW